VARGTVAEIIAGSGLVTFTIEGEGARHLAEKLRGLPGIVFVSFFGAVLHVSGYDRSLLEAALAPYRHDPNLVVRETAPSMEDVFIELQQDNGRGKA
jgi:ABC-2 type transport system ATP-binding protein